ncbi:MAG TPA: hypothetical protein PLY43_03130 [Ruminococcus sp.]|nr:hypothetical protein [Ruminococcus sp.]
MKISDNISYITEAPEKWSLFRNRSYTAKIQRSDPQREYNVPGKKGVVYNYLEDSYEPVSEGGFIVTGALGEVWPIGESSFGKYGIDKTDVGFEPVEVRTIQWDTVYAAIQIPAEIQFTLEVNYGERALLHGNRPGISHGSGDWVMVFARKEGQIFLPDFTDSGRIVNGRAMPIIYRPY